METALEGGEAESWTRGGGGVLGLSAKYPKRGELVNIEPAKRK